MPTLPKLHPGSFARLYAIPDQAQPFEEVRRCLSFIPDDPDPSPVGTIFVSDYEFLFSPNTAQLPGFLPPRGDKSSTTRDPHNGWPGEFRLPRWWAEETGYLAFFPLNPKFEVDPYQDLFRLETARDRDRHPRGITLSSTRKLQWYALEWKLGIVIQALSLKYRVPPMQDVIDTFRVVGFHKKEREFVNAFYRAKAWFSIYIAKISYLIAVAHTVDREELDCPEQPTWFRFLLNMNDPSIDEYFLDGVRAVMGKFGPDVPRAGVVLDLIDCPTHQFSPYWLRRVHVPVYYLTSDKYVNRYPTWLHPPDELATILKENYYRKSSLPGMGGVCYILASTYVTPSSLPLVVLYANPPVIKPPPILPYDAPVIVDMQPRRHHGSVQYDEEVSYHSTSILPSQDATAALACPPSSTPPLTPSAEANNSHYPPLPPPSSPPPPPPQSPPSSSSPPPWVEFLETRRQKTELIIQRETPAQRQSRLQRESNPPTVNTAVFVWEEDDEGSYKRVRTSKKYNDDTLSDFKDSQKIYNAVFNEWDCGYDFDDVDDNDDDDIIDIDCPPSSEDVRSPDTGQPTSDFHDAALASLATNRSSNPNFIRDSESWDNTAHSATLVTMFYDVYGFVVPLQPLPSAPLPLSPAQLSRLRMYIGVPKDDSSEFPASSTVLAELHQFMLAVLYHKANPLAVPSQRMDTWDLVIGNHIYIGMSKWFPCIRRVSSSDTTYYLFDLGDRKTVPWSIAVFTITAAFTVCRVHHRSTEYELCEMFLRIGVPFRTFLPYRRRAPPYVPRLMPVRRKPMDYYFTRRDYELYLSHRRDVLSNSRTSRAAAMRGGIIWRLCLAKIDRESVYAGPTKYVTDLGLSDTVDDGSLHDDHLSMDELDAIAGTYILPTGNGEQTMTVSWWPPYSIWTQYYDYDFWSDVMEAKFQKRLLDLDRGLAQPLRKQQWKEWVRGGGIVREARSAITNASLSLFNNFDHS